MDLKARRFSFYQVGFLLLWWTTFLVSGLVYWDKIKTLRATNVCTTNDLKAFIGHVMNPRYWFGVFAIALTIYGIVVLYKKCASDWPWIADSKWFILAMAGALTLLITLIGCN